MSEDGALAALAAAVTARDGPGAAAAAEQALASGCSPDELLSEAIRPTLFELARRFETGQWPAPQLMLAIKAAQAVMQILPPAAWTVGTAAVCTPEGDPHSTGTVIMGTLLSASGFRVADLGTGVPAAGVSRFCREQGCAALIISVHMLGALPAAAKMAAAAKQFRPELVVNIGGPPVSAQWAAAHGADVFAAGATDSAEAVLAAVRARSRRSAGGSEVTAEPGHVGSIEGENVTSLRYLLHTGR